MSRSLRSPTVRRSSAASSEQARFAVPAPFVLQESLEQLVTVQEAAPAARYASLGRRRARSARLRLRRRRCGPGLHPPRAAGRRARADRRVALGLLCADTRSSFGRLIAPAHAPHLRGVALPGGATRLTVPLDVAGDPLGIALVVLNRRGDFSTLSLGQLGRGAHAPHGRRAAGRARRHARRGPPVVSRDRRVRRGAQGERHRALRLRRRNGGAAPRTPARGRSRAAAAHRLDRVGRCAQRQRRRALPAQPCGGFDPSPARAARGKHRSP